MERLSPAQRLQIVQLYYENHCSTRNVFRAFRAIYGPHNRLTERTVRCTIEKFETQFSLLANTRPNRPHPACSEENIAAVSESVRDDRDESIRRRSQQLGLLYSTTWRILRKDLEARNLDDIWFQQDGATCHTARETMAILREQLGEQLISRFGPVNWPCRSCDITPVDFFLWDYVKSKVYMDKPATIEELEANITRVIGQISLEMLERVIENWNFRKDHVSRSHGQHLKEIIFKK